MSLNTTSTLGPPVQPPLTKQPSSASIHQEQQTNLLQADIDQTEMTKKAKHFRKWNRRLKIFFCCLGYKKNKDSIADVASIFAEFYSNLDVSSSEIAAGFVLLSKYQAAQREWIVKNGQLGVSKYLSSVPITSESKFLDISTAEDSHLINDLIYYMNYGLAIFGWPMQMIDDPCMLCCLCPYLLSHCCGGGGAKKRKQKAAQPSEVGNENEQKEDTKHENCAPGGLDLEGDQPIILDDNCCSCNVASFERRLRAHNYEIIYITYRVNVNVVPFLVAADHSKRSVVVAIRGSMSLSDMITDMNGQTDKLPLENCPDDWLCHRGITRAASYVKETLNSEQILARAFNCRPDLGSGSYNLVLCGHSLGAGVAAILGVLLRKQYANLRAFLYSPPGGLLSLPAVEHTKEFAVGVILGNDCVPRLGVAQLERLKYHTLLSLKSSKQSSRRILIKALFPTCLGGNKVDYDPSQSLNILHGTGGRSFDYNGSKIPFQMQPQVLYVPGRLIHIVKNHTFETRTKRFFKEPIYQAVWTDNTLYDRVLINEGILYDHLPNNLMHAMKMLFSKTLPERKESLKCPMSGQSVAQEVPSSSEMPVTSSSANVELYPRLVPVEKSESSKEEEDQDAVITNHDKIVLDENNNINDVNNNINNKTTVAAGKNSCMML